MPELRLLWADKYLAQQSPLTQTGATALGPLHIVLEDYRNVLDLLILILSVPDGPADKQASQVHYLSLRPTVCHMIWWSALVQYLCRGADWQCCYVTLIKLFFFLFLVYLILFLCDTHQAIAGPPPTRQKSLEEGEI